MKINKIEGNLWLIDLPRLALGFFVILNIIAMLCYSGGTYLDHLNPGYSFAGNFLSDLGRTMSFSGEVNFLSSQLFNMALILSGGIFAAFYFRVHKVFAAENQHTLALIGSFFGVLGRCRTNACWSLSGPPYYMCKLVVPFLFCSISLLFNGDFPPSPIWK